MAAIGAVIVAAPAHAGSGNQVFITQESLPGSTNGNSLTIDQSGADNSILRGPSDALLQGLGTYKIDQATVNSLDPTSVLLSNPLTATGSGMALQRGEGNEATLTITGSGGELQILQDTSPGNPVVQPGLAGNTAVGTVNGTGIGAIVQLGENNNANLTVGNLGTGLISQTGTGLTAALDVAPSGNGQIIQVGNGSDTGVVSVQTGATVTYTQIGNNLQPIGATGVQVISTINSGNISITQTGF